MASRSCLAPDDRCESPTSIQTVPFRRKTLDGDTKGVELGKYHIKRCIVLSLSVDVLIGRQSVRLTSA